MDSDAPQSPFTPDFALAAEPEQPRLGIVHFLVWTACAAVYLGLMRFVSSLHTLGGQVPVSTALYALPMGASLGGLLLWVARRARGLRFPRHPGEYLLVVIGLQVFVHLALGIPFWIAALCGDSGPGSATYHLILLGSGVAAALFFAWAAVRVNIRRWRWFFLVGVAGVLLPAGVFVTVRVSPYLAMFVLSGATRYSARLAIDLWLLGIVIKDHVEGRRYPWTHWLGVAVRWAFTLAGFASYLLITVGAARP